MLEKMKLYLYLKYNLKMSGRESTIMDDIIDPNIMTDFRKIKINYRFLSLIVLINSILSATNYAVQNKENQLITRKQYLLKIVKEMLTSGTISGISLLVVNLFNNMLKE